MSQTAANQLESWFAGLPDIIQSVLHEPFTSINENLKAVSGDPQALMAAAPQYAAMATAVTAMADAQLRECDQLAADWEGGAYLAIAADIGLIDRQLRHLGDSLQQVPELLEQSAAACVEAANVIISLVTSLVMFVVGIWITNLALLTVTAGTSMAAFATAALAKAAKTLSDVTRVITRLSRLLKKVAGLLERLTAILRKLHKAMNSFHETLTKMKTTAKATKGVEGLRKTAAFHSANAATAQAVGIATFGVVTPPTLVSAAEDAAKNYYDAGRAAERADDIAEEERR
ncbi:WXG100 family type VII secretion target [Actinoplanes sp. CA-252034]|uniref:WXG100 family type VII secretion target n=1 Tax=Actinoplanes sp. CA-252034 TaxID=3239906 RepID=UPI003D989114